MYNAVLQDPYIMNTTVVSWFEVFRDTKGTLRSGVLFYQDVNDFLSSGAGNSYRSDVVWNDSSDPSKGIRTSKINANHVMLTKSGPKVASMDSLRTLTPPVDTKR